MKISWLNYLCSFILFLVIQHNIISQFDPSQGCVINVNKECISNPLLTAVPFLKIVPDARSGAMGDAGLATSPDANSMHFNASKLAFAKQNFSISATYTPWLRELGLTDVYLAYLSGYHKLTDKETIGFSLRFFSLGEINFTNRNGISDGIGNPREFELAGAYARKLGDKLSAAFSAKYIHSNLATGAQVRGIEILTAKAFAADISLTYKTKVGQGNNEFTMATSISNIGSKISYTNRINNKDFLPGNLGVGAAYTHNLDSHNSLTFVFDINKLLVPTPQPFRLIVNPGELNEGEIDNPEFDLTGAENGGPDGIGDYKQQSLFSSIFGSFSDARGGLSEELIEISYSFGAEYLYNKQFAFRTGYFSEHKLKGDRQYLTLGLGVKYKVASIDISYLVPTTNTRSPLDNTFRFSLTFDSSIFQAG